MWFMDNRPMCCAGLVLLLAGTGTGIDVKSIRGIFKLSTITWSPGCMNCNMIMPS